MTSTSIKVTWAPVKFKDRNGIIKGYKVIYRALPNGNDVTEFLNISMENHDQTGEQTLTLERLNEFTNYSIRVLAFTAVGDGPLSVAQVKQTLEDSKFVFDISAVNVTFKYTVAACLHIILTAFFIFFKKCLTICNNLLLLHYDIQYRQQFLCGDFFEIFYTVCLLPLILSNFMKDKSVAEHSSYISSLDY